MSTFIRQFVNAAQEKLERSCLIVQPYGLGGPSVHKEVHLPESRLAYATYTLTQSTIAYYKQ